MGRRFERKLVRGEPITVGNRTLVPVARVTTFNLSGDSNQGGGGISFTRIAPVAILERMGDEERRIPIPDMTANALGGMLLGAFVMWFMFMLAERIVESKRGGEKHG